MKDMYFGWRLVAVGFFMQMIVFAPMINLSGIYIIPLSEHFGVLRSAATMTSTFALATSIVASMLAGKLLSRYNIRKMMASFLAVSAVGCLLCAAAPNLLTVILGSIIRGASLPFMTVIPLSILVGNWFGKEIRGRAWAVTTMGSGVGIMLISPMVAAILVRWGWRGGYVFYAILALVMIPFVLLTCYTYPSDKGLEQKGKPAGAEDSAVELKGVLLKDAMKGPVLWLFLGACVMMGGSAHIWNLKNAAFFSDLGYSLFIIPLLLSVSSIGLTLSKFFLGAICDKHGTRTGLIISSLSLMSGFLVFIISYTLPRLAFVGAFGVGFGLSVISITPILMARDLFGDRDYGTISGVTQSFISIGTVIFPQIAAAGFDRFGNYIPAWGGACLLTMSAMFIALAAYRTQARA